MGERLRFHPSILNVTEVESVSQLVSLIQINYI